MSVLITGGLSEFASCLAKTLISQGNRVVLLHNGIFDEILKSLDSNNSLTLINLSSVNEDGIKNLIEEHKVKIVFDVSLKTLDVFSEPKHGAKKMILGITSVLDAIRKASSMPSLVLMSDRGVYGESENQIETQPLEPVTFCHATMMSVEAMVHSYAVSYRIPTVIGRLPHVMTHSRTLKFANEPERFVNILSYSDAVNGILSIAPLADSQKPAEVFNVCNSLENKVGDLTVTRDAKQRNDKILGATNWKPTPYLELSESEEKESHVKLLPSFLVFGEDNTLKTKFLKTVTAEGMSVKESAVKNFQEASDKLVFEEVNRVNPSHLVYFSNDTEFEGDCFTLRTNVATNLFFPWLLASIAEKSGIHFTHFGNTIASEETSSLAVKGYTGKMLEYFENTLRLGEEFDASALELINKRKTGTLNNNSPSKYIN